MIVFRDVFDDVPGMLLVDHTPNKGDGWSAPQIWGTQGHPPKQRHEGWALHCSSGRSYSDISSLFYLTL